MNFNQEIFEEMTAMCDYLFVRKPIDRKYIETGGTEHKLLSFDTKYFLLENTIQDPFGVYSLLNNKANLFDLLFRWLLNFQNITKKDFPIE